MGTFTKIVVVIFLGIIAIPVGCFGGAVIFEALTTHTHRYRLAIEVETPTGVKSSASVIEVSIWEKATWFPQTGGVGTSVRGEAVFVDLGDGRNLIATLGFGPLGDEDRVAWLAAESLGPTHASAEVRASREYWREVSSWTGSADAAYIPLLVTFSDLNDPKTARVVRPEEFEQVFGPGVRFKRVFVEMVSTGTWPFSALGWPKSLAGEPVTRVIFQRLPWLAGFKGYSGGQGQPDWSRPEKNLTGDLFTRGAIR